MNTFTLTITVAAALWVTGCSADRKALTGNHMASTDSLTIELNSFLQKSLIPGFSVSIVNDKEISQHFGPFQRRVPDCISAGIPGCALLSISTRRPGQAPWHIAI